MKIKRKIVLLVLLGFSCVSYGANKSADGLYEIEKLTFHSNEETIYPDYNGTVIVDPSPNITWNDNANCKNNVVVVKQGDSHLVSALLAAYMSSTKVRFYVDDSVHVASNYCFLRAIGYDK